jgi:hypothetical protein
MSCIPINDFSLISLCDATKAGKLYSIVPDDGSGDFDVARNSTATYLGADGLIKTAAIDEPRIEFNPDGSYKGLLVEPQRTNLLLRSEEFDLSPWSTPGLTITPNDTTDPTGGNSGTKITGNNTLNQSISVTNGLNYTVSIFAKADTQNILDLRIFPNVVGGIGQVLFDLSNGTFTVVSGATNVKMESYPNGWFRCSQTVLANATGSNTFRIRTGSDSIFLWGAQVEEASTASSYIKTEASTVTRVADVVSKTGISSLIGQTEGTLYADIQLTTTGFWYLSLSSGTNQNWIFIGLENNTLRGFLRSGGVTYATIQTGVITSGRFKMAIAYKLNDVVFYVNGTQIGSDTSAVMPTGLANFYLTSSEASGGNQTIIGVIKAAAILPTRLSNAQLEALTS